MNRLRVRAMASAVLASAAIVATVMLPAVAAPAATRSTVATGVDETGAASSPSFFSAAVEIRPSSGPPGTVARVRGTGWDAQDCGITIYFTDADGTWTTLRTVPPASSWKTKVSIPSDSAVGPGTVRAEQRRPAPDGCKLIDGEGWATFTVTSRRGWSR